MYKKTLIFYTDQYIGTWNVDIKENEVKDTMAAGLFKALEDEIEDAGMNIKMSE